MIKDFKILFKFPTRERPDKFFSTLDLYYKNIVNPNFQFIISLDTDDVTMNNDVIRKKLDKYKKLKYYYSENKNKIQACNADIPDKGWDIIVLVSDDMIPQVEGFDEIIRVKFKILYPNLDGVLWFNDGYQSTRINTLSILGRKYYDRFGYIYHSDYITMLCDDEFTNVAGNLGRQSYFPDIIIKHEHPSLYSSIPFDSLYRKNLDSKLYDKDKETFEKRRNLGFPKESIFEAKENIIPKVMNFYWSEGVPLSYLRYLTIKSFRHFHRDWKIKIWLFESNVNHSWNGREKQDFQNKTKRHDWLNLDTQQALKYEVIRYKNNYNLAPNYIGDILRIYILKRFGGWTADLDQIFLRNIDELCNYNFIYGCKKHTYGGILGANKSNIPEFIYNEQIQLIQRKKIKNYCQLGNWLLSDLFKTTDFKNISAKENVICTENYFFYPVTDSDDAIKTIKNKDFVLPLNNNNYAYHWFGGHPISQEFNDSFTPEYLLKSNDSLSKFLKKENIW